MKTTHRRQDFIRSLVLALAGLSVTMTAVTAQPVGAPPDRSASSQAAVRGGWAEAVQRDIEQREYEVTWQERPFVAALSSSWHAPNRAHGFRTYFTDEGLRVIPRAENSLSWQWGLRLYGIGRGGSVLAAGRAVLTPSSNRLTYDRGSIVEWYVNDRRGLEQWMTLLSPPEEHDGWPAAPDDSSSPLSVVFALDGDLSPLVSADGQAIDFLAPGGARALRYAGLVVTDAAGRVVPARMEGWNDAGARGIRLVIEDAGAVWPLTIDPLLTSPAWTAESDQDSAWFGIASGTAGDVNGDGYGDVIVGAYRYDNGETDEGRAYVYHGSASGLSLTPAWTAESNQAGALFGYSVLTAGDVNGDGFADVIVGAVIYADDQSGEGRAWVYHGSSSGLSAAANWTADGDSAGAGFGSAAGTAGDVNGDGYSDVIVGAYTFANGQSGEGRALVYHGAATGLSPSPNWTVEGNQADARFGNSVGTAGDVNGDGFADVIVGAPFFDAGQPDEGLALVYHGSAAGLSLTPDWTAESNQTGARFGYAAATAGDVNGDGHADVIVGADAYTSGENAEGRAFVYLGAGAGLSTTASWTAESNQSDALFGYSVGTAGDVNGDGYAEVIAGAVLFDGGQVDEGRAYLYHGSATGPSPTANWTAESDQTGAIFGYAAGTAGDVNGDGYSDVIAGAYSFDNGQPDEGRAFVYHGSASGLSSLPGWSAESDQPDARFGIAVDSAGDVNGDGYADVIVGANEFDNGQTGEGRAFLYHGSASGLSTAPVWMAEGDQPGAWFGIAVGSAGDVNGDGYADVIVGASQFNNGENNEGRAYVYHGSALGLAAVPGWMAEGNQQSAEFGVSAGTAGDVNGDGFSDVIVGAHLFDNEQPDEGRVYAYHGSAAGLTQIPSWTAEGNSSPAQFGFSVAAAGDVNGDGYGDVIVGAPGGSQSYVYHGSATGLSSWPAWSGYSGASVSTAGDVNGDGFADVIVGDDRFSNGEFREGMAFVYLGGAGSGLSLDPSFMAEGNKQSAWFGLSVGTAGDINGDGFSDIVIGAPGYSNGQFEEGRAFLFFGSASGPAPATAWTAEVDQNYGRFGWSVASAGDVNGDGYTDIIVGAPLFDNLQTDEGGAYVYYGNGGPGLSLRPQQRRRDDTAPIAPLGASDSRDSFRVAATGRSPFGRSLVRLEWEVKPLGSPLDGTGTQSSLSWTDTGTAGIALNEVISALPGDIYHWRLRLRYHPATSPLASHSRWLTGSWNGPQEADVRIPALADLAVTQADSGDPILLGAVNLSYTVSVVNIGPDRAPVLLRDTLPSGPAFMSASPSQGACAPPVAGVLACDLGQVQAGASATVIVTVTPQAAGTSTNSAVASLATAGSDPVLFNNTSSETTTVLIPSIGDRIWVDADGDGIQDPGEPGLEDVLVTLHDGSGTLIAGTLTNSSGGYLFSGLAYGAAYRIRVWTPTGYMLSPRDQGMDDQLDSDVNPATQLSPVSLLVSGLDPVRWDAGLIPELPACELPDEPIFISDVTLTTDGNDYPILHYQDANQPGQVTGYNVRRTSNPALPKDSWPIVASNVIDMDEATPNKQWVDTSGATPPGGIWYYQVTAFNSRCPAEGPF